MARSLWWVAAALIDDAVGATNNNHTAATTRETAKKITVPRRGSICVADHERRFCPGLFSFGAEVVELFNGRDATSATPK